MENYTIKNNNHSSPEPNKDSGLPVFSKGKVFQTFPNVPFQNIRNSSPQQHLSESADPKSDNNMTHVAATGTFPRVEEILTIFRNQTNLILLVDTSSTDIISILHADRFCIQHRPLPRHLINSQRFSAADAALCC